MTTPAVIPLSVRELAEDGNAFMPPLPGEERIPDRRFIVRFMKTPLGQFNQICRIRLAPEELEAAVAEVRGLLAARGIAGACEWEVGSSATPGDLVARLAALGVTPMPDQPFAPALALVTPPRVRPRAGVRVTRATTPEEEATASEIQSRGFGNAEPWSDERRAEVAAEHAAAPRREGSRTYLAWVEDRPAAAAGGFFTAAGVIAAGAATLPEFRGRGAFQALVAARWEDAVARGTPALVCHAGDMSRPILERLGFVAVARMEFLNDSWKP